MEEEKKDETNFLLLPEIRMPGMVYSAPFQVQGQTQYCRATEQAGKGKRVKGKVEMETNQ